jgi:hypothetical protein
MSRYWIQARQPRYEIVIGWDKPLHTFFAQVWDEKSISEDPELWVGVAFGQMPTCEHLEQILKPYADIPEDICIQLTKDKEQPALDLIRDMCTAGAADQDEATSPIESEE